MPKNIVRMEKLFDLQDKFRRPTNTKTGSSSLLYEVVNLDIEQILRILIMEKIVHRPREKHS
jgi:hypothetical protein